MRKMQIDARFPYVEEFQDTEKSQKIIVKAPVPIKLSKNGEGEYKVQYQYGSGFMLLSEGQQAIGFAEDEKGQKTTIEEIDSMEQNYDIRNDNEIIIYLSSIGFTDANATDKEKVTIYLLIQPINGIKYEA